MMDMLLHLVISQKELITNRKKENHTVLQKVHNMERRVGEIDNSTVAVGQKLSTAAYQLSDMRLNTR